MGNVVVSRHCEHRRPKRAKEFGGALELLAPAAMREISRRDDELRLDLLDERRDARLDVPLLVRAHVEVGNVEEACCHSRTRL
jgi:hypothetical protein